jgi:hypothetical protein
VQLLLCYLRAAELEMRAAEEPLKSDLDVKGLKSQVATAERSMQVVEYEFRRISLPRTLVNKGKKKGRCVDQSPGPRLFSRLGTGRALS